MALYDIAEQAESASIDDLQSTAEKHQGAFLEGLEQRSPTLQLDWFREGVGEFAVVLIYEDREQFKNSARLLANAGVPLN